MSSSLIRPLVRQVNFRHASTTVASAVRPSPRSARPTATTRRSPKLAPFNGVASRALPPDTTKGELGQVVMPDMDSIERAHEEQVKIPGEPDNYSNTGEREDDFPHLRSPRVQTVAHPATHPSAPVHGSTAEDVVVEAIEPGESQEQVPHDQDISRRPKEQDEQDGDQVNLAWKIQWPQQDKDYEFQDRPLNGEERRGLVVLGGIVLGGYLLGGLGQRKVRKEPAASIEQ